MTLSQLLCFLYCLSLLRVTNSGAGLLLLYRPIDVTDACAFSGRLRYDLSFGMGMSDTITMVFRTLSDIDYTCFVEVAAMASDIILIMVIKFPTNIALNCAANGDAFQVIKNQSCRRLCDLTSNKPMHSTYFVATIKESLVFRFLSNSSINGEIDANMYQVSVTAARLRQPLLSCNPRNESLCVIEQKSYCLTNGVVCDGIKQCGINDWFDERKAGCSLPIEYLGVAPVIAVVLAVTCMVLACGHVLLRCLPPLAISYFIFNANEDNRLCIDPVFQLPEGPRVDIEKPKRLSLIPVSSSSSSNTEIAQKPCVDMLGNSSRTVLAVLEGQNRKQKKSGMTEKFQEKFRNVTGIGRKSDYLKNKGNELEDV